MKAASIPKSTSEVRQELTAQQREACQASGNVLLMAGAGTGKTSTLVQRCLGLVLRPEDQVSLEQVLVVTFTEAAAAEMRKRLRAALDEQVEREPENPYLAEQRALLDIAHISTLHSFCLRLLREHFFELGLDPQFTVLVPTEAMVLAQRAIRSVFEPHYRSSSPIFEQLLHWVGQRGEGRLGPLEKSVLKVYRYAQTLPSPRGWLAQQQAFFQAVSPREWEQWLREEMNRWLSVWRPVLERLAPRSLLANQTLEIMGELSPTGRWETIGRALDQLLAGRKDAGRKEKGDVRQEIDDFFKDAEFMASVCQTQDGVGPIQEDWDWVRPQILALIQLVEEFSEEFSRLKREQSGVDFHDLEQFTLRLLWADNQPSPLAREWQEKLKAILVDEYQDINPAQDAILRAISQEKRGGNRFLVGDIKQSIYRFRLANPRIFQSYAEAWNGPAGKVIPLTENFRSYEMILHFVNAFFSSVMSPELGGVEYNAQAALHFGNSRGRRESSAAFSSEPRVELQLVVLSEDDQDQENASEPSEMAANTPDDAMEPAVIAARLRGLKASGFQVREGDQDRPVEWRDMVILQRSLADKTEAYARAFLDAEVPLIVSPEGFYSRAEVQDLLNLLRVLDNPIQDIPLLGVLSSPLGGFAPSDLAEVRVTNKKISFWAALQLFHRDGERSAAPSKPSTSSAASLSAWEKTGRFLRSFARWRDWSRHLSVAQCLERILDETHYEDWLRTRRNGMQEIQNVQRFLHIAHQFDESRHPGLRRFLQHLEAQDQGENEASPPGSLPQNAVRLMTIHQSKGLEFPIVVLAGLGKSFNWQDLQADFIIDEVFGICPKIVPPHLPQPYPSVAYWLARKKERLELLGEEIRLLYVAMTRAESWLILAGLIKNKKSLERWASLETAGLDVERLKKAKTALEWITAWVSRHLQRSTWVEQADGISSLFRWKIQSQVETPKRSDPVLPNGKSTPHCQMTPPKIGALEICGENGPTNRLQALSERLRFEYPFMDAVTQPAKTSASHIRHGLPADPDQPMEWPAPSSPLASLLKLPINGALDAKDVGIAHHRFLELVRLDHVDEVASLEQEASRLQECGALSLGQRACLNLPAIARFWQSVPGRKIRSQAPSVHRELAFTCRFLSAELAGLAPGLEARFADEFLIVQGVIDLAVIGPEEIWVVDFKTDAIAESDLGGRLEIYAVQMAIYRQALKKIYGRPVTEQWLCFLELDRVVPCYSGGNSECTSVELR